MDVTFTNVLEGARQYFQGLPAATGSTASPASVAYPPSGEAHHNPGHGNDHSSERASSAVTTYWPPQETQGGGESTTPSETPPRTPHQQPERSVQLPVNNEQNNQTYYGVQMSSAHQQYHFQRPQTREVPSNPTSHHQQFQQTAQNQMSHYHQMQPPTQGGRPSTRPHEHATPSSHGQSYHQMQTPRQSPHSQVYPGTAYQQPRSYYPTHSEHQPVSHHTQSQSYSQTSSSNQTHVNQQNAHHYEQFTSQSQTPATRNENQYTVPQRSRESTTSNENKTAITSQSQSHRTTHNLPPIAALSSVNYLSNRSTAQLRCTNHTRQRTSTAITTPVATMKPVGSAPSVPLQQDSSTNRPPAQYPIQNNTQCETYSNYSNINGVSSNSRTTTNTTYHQQYSYNTNPTYSYPVAAATTNVMSSTSSSTPSSSYSQSSIAATHFQPPVRIPHHENVRLSQATNSTKSHSYPTHPNHSAVSHNVVRQENPPVNNRTVPIIKQKRESPLDLSVKTVRTPADSTLDDTEVHSTDARLGKMYAVPSRNMPPPRQPTQVGNYPTYDVHANVFQRSMNPRPTTVPSSGAPKVDFLPDFHVSLANSNRTNYSTVDNRRTTATIQQQPPNQIPPYPHRVSYDKKSSAYTQSNAQYSNASQSSRHPVVSAANSSSLINNTYAMPQAPPDSKKTPENLPRIDFPPPGLGHKTSAMYPVPPRDPHRKRTADTAPVMVPNKVPKVDSWRRSIDQQIEQRFSSYTNSRIQQEQQIKQSLNNTGKPFLNGNSILPNHQRQHEYYNSSYQKPQYQNPEAFNQYHRSSTMNHNQTYIPSAMAHHQYPTQIPQQQETYGQLAARSNSLTKLHMAGSNKHPVGAAADKRVLSILRNSLEIKGAKEAQKKLEQEQMKPQEYPVHRPEVQQPSTDVTAPLQPKLGIVGRHNVSPFTAASLLERNSNTPPYKFHVPRAIDSIRYDSEALAKNNTKLDDNISNYMPSDLDGLAAFLAARIRTKAELKQVGPSHGQVNNNSSTSPSLATNSVESAVPNKPMDDIVNLIPGTNRSPPKLTREKPSYQPRKRLFSRSEEEPTVSTGITTNVACLPPRDKSLRSSSETSVFDFPDTDSEGEMPVLERQSLDDMRRDRKSVPKPPEVKIEEMEEEGVTDPFWADTCDKFMEQLRSGGGKKRGRRKKIVEPEVIVPKVEADTNEEPILQHDIQIKTEKFDEDANPEDCSTPITNEDVVEVENIKVETIIPKVEADSDSDVPLVKHVNKKNNIVADIEDSTELVLNSRKENTGAQIKLQTSSDSDSDSDSETIKAVSERLKQHKLKTDKSAIVPNKVGRPRSKDTSPTKLQPQKVNSVILKKPAFGDGSDFHPGWEEEVYKYKRSLRMPPGLIQVSRPPHWHRLSTSLPDLDPCPNSPAASSCADITEFALRQNSRIKQESIDSDVDSNSSFSFSLQKSAYDSEEGTSSTVILPNKSNTKCKSIDNNSILDRLVQRYGSRRRKKLKGKNQKGPKVIPKPENPLELLPTPSLKIPKVAKPSSKTVKENNKSSSVIQKNDSMHLGFRKKTINNFKDAFLNKKGNEMVGVNEQFATVVMKSRTRTETRVLKQRATIREVFGEERPASAPPITCVENRDLSEESRPIHQTRLQTENKTIKGKENTSNQTSPIAKTPTSLENTKKVLKNKIIQRGRKQHDNLLKVLVNKKINSAECSDDESIIKSEIKSETPSIDGEAEDATVPTKRRYKFKNMRRKLSSGFDYIRKKKKQIKKEAGENETPRKIKRRGLIPRANPESVQDIQREIKLWVMNKGVGETHLHRAARLGYTDVTAYCLEKMNCPPSPKDNAGYTPLHEACARGHLDIARLLLLYGANVSESAQGGIRPLHEAAENGFVEIVRLLLSYGADATLATYTGLTPLSLATDDATIALMHNHLAETQGMQVAPWHFQGPAHCFDPDVNGFDPLQNVPSPDPVSEEEDMDFEVCEFQLPNLYILRGEPSTDRWVLLQDLSAALKIKSRDALLRQISPAIASTSGASGPSNNYKNIFRELKMADFLEQARCCQFLSGGEKINTRASKIALVKYTDKVKQLLGVEKVIVTAR